MLAERRCWREIGMRIYNGTDLSTALHDIRNDSLWCTNEFDSNKQIQNTTRRPVQGTGKGKASRPQWGKGKGKRKHKGKTKGTWYSRPLNAFAPNSSAKSKGKGKNKGKNKKGTCKRRN